MAVTDAYATSAEYKSRVEMQSNVDDAEIEGQLYAASRMIDRYCSRFFTKDVTAQVRIYDGGTGVPTNTLLLRELYQSPFYGASKLYLPDDISGTSGLIVKVDLDGDRTNGYEETLTLDTHFVLGPYNAALGPEPAPYTWVEILPDNGVLETWPSHRRSVQITAKFGWPTVPYAITEATVMLVRLMRDLQEAGLSGTLTQVEQIIQVRPETAGLFQNIYQNYGRARRTFS